MHTRKIILDLWLLGAGVGKWDLLYPRYALGEFIAPGYYFRRPHNDLLLIFSETCLLGIATFLSFWGLTFFLIFQLLKKIPSKTAKRALLGFGVSLLAISGHACFRFPLERITPLMFWSFLPGIIFYTPTKNHFHPVVSMYAPFALPLDHFPGN